MKFSIDQRVRMKRTENVGTVTRILPGNLVQVKLDGGLGHIPIPVEALEPVAPPAPPRPQAKAAPQPAPVREVTKAVLHEGAGIQLAFDPQLDNEANPTAYEVYLLNGTGEKVIYELKTLTGANRRWSKSGILEAGKKKRLEAVDYRWLNDKLSVEVDVRPVILGGTGPRHFERIRIKPAQFFAKYQDVPALYRDAHLYDVFPALRTESTAPGNASGSSPAAAPPSRPSLKSITQQYIDNKPKPQPNKKLVLADLQERREFETTLDLHLDSLVPDPSAIPKHQKLQLQLKAYDEYIEEALKLGVDSVIVIHGLGNGVLKRAIHSRLHRTKFVRDFKNEYHPRYGFGATEIVFD